MIPGHGLHKGRAAEQDAARLLRRWGCTTERRGLGQSGLPDLVVSLDGTPLPFTVSVKARRDASLVHLLNRHGPTWVWWKEAAEHPHPWLLLRLPRPWGWWLVWWYKDYATISIWAGRDPGRCKIILYEETRDITAHPLPAILAWTTPQQMQAALK